MEKLILPAADTLSGQISWSHITVDDLKFFYSKMQD